MEVPTLSKRYGISLDEREALEDFLTSDIYKLIIKVLQAQVSEIGANIMKIRLDNLSQDSLHSLAAAKLKYEGAEKLLNEFKLLKTQIKNH